MFKTGAFVIIWLRTKGMLYGIVILPKLVKTARKEDDQSTPANLLIVI